MEDSLIRLTHSKRTWYLIVVVQLSRHPTPTRWSQQRTWPSDYYEYECIHYFTIISSLKSRRRIETEIAQYQEEIRV